MIKTVRTTTDSLEKNGIEISEDQNSSHFEIQRSLESIRHYINLLLDKQKRIAIAIAGGPVSGKTSVITPTLIKEFPSILVISEDDYCIGNTESQKLHGVPNLYVPEDFDPELLARHITELKQGKSVEKPIYSYEVRERLGSIRTEAHDILVVEGLFLLYPPLNEQFDVRIFIDTNDHTRFIRRLLRKRRNPDQTDLERIKEYFNLSFRYYHELITPTSAKADFVIANDYDASESTERCSAKTLECLLTGDIDKILKKYSEKRRNKFRTQYYGHPKFKPGEVLSITEHGVGGNQLKYAPGSSKEGDFVVTPSAVFYLEDEQFDLSEIGYGFLSMVEGEEIVLVENENLKIRVVRLSDGRMVLHLTQQQYENANDALLEFKKRLMEQGLALLSDNFDQWALNEFKC